MDFFKKINDIFKSNNQINPRRILVIDNLSYIRKINNFDFGLLLSKIKKNYNKSEIFIISNTNYSNFKKCDFVPSKAFQVNKYFNDNNIKFDMIIDSNSLFDYLQLAQITLLFSTLNYYGIYVCINLPKTSNIRSKYIYTLMKFTKKIGYYDNYNILIKI